MKSPKAKQGVLLALFILTALSFVSCTATKQPNTAATTDVQLTAAAETSATPTTAIQITTQVATQEPSTTASMETTEAEMPTESPTYESYVGTWSNTDDPMMGGMGIQFRAFDGNIACVRGRGVCGKPGAEFRARCDIKYRLLHRCASYAIV